MAEKILKKMMEVNEEDVITHLANIIFKIHTRNFDSALNIIDEVKDKYSNSFKLMSLKGICHMEKGEHQQALKVLTALFTQIKDKDTYPQDEKEQCLVMLHKLCFKLGRKNDYLE